MKKFVSSSKEGQDILVYTLVQNGGFFLDIGCGDPISGNNTYSLEQIGWTGLLFDQSDDSLSACRKIRRSLPIKCQAETFDWEKCLSENNVPEVIDYISLDMDDGNRFVLKNFPWDRYLFKVMTFEHDNYQRGSGLKALGDNTFSKYPYYTKILNNALVTGLAWEDWYINCDLVDNRDAFGDTEEWSDFLKRLLLKFSQ